MKTQKDEGAPQNGMKATTLAPPMRHTAVTLLALVGSAERDTVVSYVMGATQADLIERGARIATTRVVDEGAAIAGVAAEFMAVATPAQRRLLATVTPTFLSALATGLHIATGMDATLSRRRARAATRRKAAKVVAVTALPGIRARRELFRTHLLAMNNGDPGWASRINDACGAAPGALELAASLDKMVTEGRALAAHTKARGGEVTVDDAYFTEMTGLAATARKSHEDARSGADDGVSQAQLDWWDGANLWFLGALVDNFEQARAIDRTIPRLTLGALANALKPGRAASRKRTAKPAPQPAPQPARPVVG